MASFGGQAPKTLEQKALDATKTSQYTFINKDFVKNMAFLNQTVDIHTQFLNKLQKGVDAANENIFEQIQGFAADLFLIFAGLEPTGIDIGDLKYVFQALGAIFGINPSTPFPLNLFEAVGHMFTSYIAPLEQFTDVIFDAISAWALELGFDPAFLDAVGNLKDTIESLGHTMGDLFGRILDLFNIFGGLGSAFDPAAGLLSNIMDFFSDIVMPSLKPVLQTISSWTVPFINALTGTVHTIETILKAFMGEADEADLLGILNFASIFNGINFNTLSFNPIGAAVDWLGSLIPRVGNVLQSVFGNWFSWIPVSSIFDGAKELLFNGQFDGAGSIELNGTTEFSWDGTVYLNGGGEEVPGSAKCIGNGNRKYLRSNDLACTTGQKFNLEMKVLYRSALSSGNPITLQVVPFIGLVEQTPITIAQAAPALGANPTDWHGTIAGDKQLSLSGQWTVPANITKFVLRIGLSGLATSGTYWYDGVSCKAVSNFQMGWVSGLLDVFEGLFQRLGGVIGGTIEAGLNGIGTVFNNLLKLFDVSHVSDMLTGFDITTVITQFANNVLNPIGFFANLISGKLPDIQAPPIVATFNTMFNQIGDVFNNVVVTPINGVITNVVNWFADLLGFRKKTVINQTTNQQFTISATSSVVRQPGWVSESPLCAVTYPAILNSYMIVYADTVGPATAGTAHSHAIRGRTDNASAQNAWWTIGVNESRGGFVTATEDMVFSKFGVLATADTTPAANSIKFEIFRELLDGSLVLVTWSDASSWVTTAEQQIIRVWTDFRIIARKGERYLLRLTNVGPTDCGLSVKGMRWDTGVPNVQWYTSTSTDTNKTSYTAAEVDTIQSNSVVTPWFILAADESDIPESSLWTDNFSRDVLGYYWDQNFTGTAGKLVINNDCLSYGGSVNGFEQAIYIHPTSTDGWKLTVDLINVNNAAALSFWCGMDRAAQNGVIINVNSTALSIQTIINGSLSTRDTVSRTDNNGQLTLQFNAVTRLYKAQFNGGDIDLDWTDSGNVVPKGINNRYGLAQIQRVSGLNAGQVENWTLQDLVA